MRFFSKYLLLPLFICIALPFVLPASLLEDNIRRLTGLPNLELQGRIAFGSVQGSATVPNTRVILPFTLSWRPKLHWRMLIAQLPLKLNLNVGEVTAHTDAFITLYDTKELRLEKFYSKIELTDLAHFWLSLRPLDPMGHIEITRASALIQQPYLRAAQMSLSVQPIVYGNEFIGTQKLDIMADPESISVQLKGSEKSRVRMSGTAKLSRQGHIQSDIVIEPGNNTDELAFLLSDIVRINRNGDLIIDLDTELEYTSELFEHFFGPAVY